MTGTRRQEYTWSMEARDRGRGDQGLSHQADHDQGHRAGGEGHKKLIFKDSLMLKFKEVVFPSFHFIKTFHKEDILTG